LSAKPGFFHGEIAAGSSSPAASSRLTAATDGRFWRLAWRRRFAFRARHASAAGARHVCVATGPRVRAYCGPARPGRGRCRFIGVRDKTRS
jgi:hypothetical protein